jgi:hypothetical protein
MVGILLNSCPLRENSNDLHLSLGFVLRERPEFEGAYGVAKSESLTGASVLRRRQGAMSYKFRTRPGVKNELRINQ